MAIIPTSDVAPQPTIDVNEPLIPDAPIVNPFEPQQEPTEFEPTQVAGVGSIIKKAIKKAPLKTDKPIVTPGQEVEKIGPYQVIPEAEPAKAEQILQQAPQMPTAGKPSPTPAQQAMGVQETVFNLDQIQDEDGLKQFIESTARVYGADKIEAISYKEVAAKASEEGYDEAFLARIIDPSKQTTASPEFAYKMLLALTDAGKRAYDLGNQVKAAAANGTLTPELATEFHQAVALEGVLLRSAKGRQADIARTLGIFSQARQSTAQRGAQLQAVLNEAGGIDNAYDLATKYTALDSRAARSSLSEKTVGGTIKDIWFSTWINGLLSSPVTHAKNLAGNMFFGAIQIPERAVASVIGKGRNLFFGGEEAIQMNEVYAQAYGMLQGIREGAVIGMRAARKNEPTDPFSKIESSRLGRDPFAVDFGDTETGRAMSNALEYWGKFVTLPGRALMAEDEFFKAVGYRMELNALATRAANQEYKKLIDAGIDEDQAVLNAENLMVSILNNPPPDIDEAATGMARTVTFTRELESGLQGMQKTLQNPLLKMFVPFVRTPTNIALEAITRTPGLNFASPRFWADYNAGGIRRDMAMAKVTLGSAMIFGTGAYALEGKMTGYGPYRYGDKQALEGTGWQQFSFVFNKDDVSPELLEQYRQITTVKEGPDKYYISYAGLEPLSTLLAISSTASEYSMLTAGEADLEKLMIGGTLGVYQYLSEQPMLQGFSEINDVLTSGAKDAPTFLYNIMAKVAKQSTELAIGGSPLGVHSSFVAAVERLVNPNKSNTMEALSPEEINPSAGAAKGFWEAVSYYKSRNPLTSDNLPPQLDAITGEVKRAGKGNLYEMFSPFRNSDGKFSPAHAILVEYGIPQYQPPRKIKSVELTAEQYNRMIELATQDGRLEQAITSIGKDSGFIRLAAQDLGAAQAIIADQISKSYSIARDILISEDMDLYQAIKDLEELGKEQGQYRR